MENGSFAKAPRVVVAAAYAASADLAECEQVESRSVAIASHPIVTLASFRSQTLDGVADDADASTKALLIIPLVRRYRQYSPHPRNAGRLQHRMLPERLYAVHLTTVQNASSDNAPVILDKALEKVLAMCQDRGSVNIFGACNLSDTRVTLRHFPLKERTRWLRFLRCASISDAFVAAEGTSYRIVSRVRRRGTFPEEDAPAEIPGETVDQLDSLAMFSSKMYKPQQVDLTWFKWLGGKVEEQ